jgi:putative polyhydroxyalkanoate system protein
VTTIDIAHRHSLPRGGARRAADFLVKDLEARLGLSGLIAQWRRDTLYLSACTGPAQGTTGEVALGEDAVRVTLSLSPAHLMMRKTIEVGVAQFLKKSFSS